MGRIRKTTGLVPVRKLAAMLKDPSSAACRALGRLHPDGSELTETASLCLDAVRAFRSQFGDEALVFMARSTGRINLMGMHVDHRGGFVNPIAIKDMFFVVEPRDDDTVCICNADGQAFPASSFRTAQELPAHKIEDWDAWSHQQLEARQRLGTDGHWSNYVKAAVLYLQHVHMRSDGSLRPALRGMNMAVKGAVPMAAGLSSSSAVVVGSMEACAAVNALSIEPLQMVEMCRLAEWYVGTRGGGGDHAAIKFGKKGHVLRVGSFPFSVDLLPFPEGYSVVLANSLVEARKQEGARDLYNERVASYEFGLRMLRHNYPRLAPRMEHLRDVNPRTLGVSEADLYRMIRSLPQSCKRAEVVAALADEREQVERIFRTHGEPPLGYRIRQVCAYGVAECMRSDMAGQMLRERNVKGFGELMNIGHEGDRVTRLAGGRRVANDNSLPDAKLDWLIADAESGDAARVERARLWRQPGGYNVSTPEQDILVDVARGVPGVVGARLVGAGLGGSVIILVEERQAQAVISALSTEYYGPRGLPLKAEFVRPVDGSGIVDLTGKA